MENQCTATAKISGNQCRKPAIRGGTVCRMHGGAAPQVIAKARERLAGLVEPAIDRIEEALGDEDSRVALAASRDVLDRNDLSGKTKHEHTGAVETVGSIAVRVVDAARASD